MNLFYYEAINFDLPGVLINNPDDTDTETKFQSQHFFFFDTPRSTGRNLATTAIQQILKSERKRVLAVASSAAAAQLLNGDRAAHSAL